MAVQKMISLNLTESLNNIQFQAYKDNITELNIYNNYKNIDVQRLFAETLPYSEDFEQVDEHLRNSNFVTINPDYQNTWMVDSTEGLEGSSRSLKMPFVYYEPREQQNDYLILGMFDIPQTGNTLLNFNHSYTQYFNSRKDSLFILVSTACDLSSGDTVFAKGGASLKTRPSNFMGFYTPTLPEEWADNSINLTDYAGQTIIIRLVTSNGGGNNLYLDNIKIENGIDLGIKARANNEVKFYPNPAKERIFFDETSYNKTIDIISSDGKSVLTTTIKSSGIDISNLPAGNYLIECSDGTSGKLIIQ